MSDANIQEYESRLRRSMQMVEKARAKLEAIEHRRTEPIAVIGLGCRFPGGADDPAAFWRLLADGVDAIGEVPPDRWDIDALYDPDPGAPGKVSTRWGGFLPQVDQFDAAAFGISPREAARMDPQQRLLLEVTWEALEHAGLPASSLAGSQTGVFLGICANEYSRLQAAHLEDIDAWIGTGNALSIAANRLSYLLDLKGPSLAIDTACSSSLVALHLATLSLRQGESRIALAGGVNLLLGPESTIAFSKAHMMAADGRCKTFDARADGYVRGEGCGVVVLKRLSDAQADGDAILAVIRGTAVNQDGATSGLTAPNGRSQEAALRQALENAGLKPGALSYVEAHGTGTPLGDPIEVEALSRVHGQGQPSGAPCLMGSVKTNIGHLEGAAGIAGVIKVVLSLQAGQIPPHLHFRALNPYIDLSGSRLEIPTRLTPWAAGGPRYAGVSSFGFGGTNAHVILGEAPADQGSRPPEGQEDEDRNPGLTEGGAPTGLHLLPLSARAPEALRALAGEWARHLGQDGAPELADLCFTAQLRRDHHLHRLAITGQDVAQLRGILARFADEGPGDPTPGLSVGHRKGARAPKLAFIYAGQGSQTAAMGRELMETEPTFRQVMEACDAAFRIHAGWSFLEVLASESAPDRIHDTEVTQPALVAYQLGLTALWGSWGITPDTVIGHSVGEIAAAHAAGALSLDDAMRLVAHRGRLMAATAGQGRMASIDLPEEAARARLEGSRGALSVAAVNAPHATVIAGESAALDALVAALDEEGVRHQRLAGAYAFHSAQMEPIGAALAEAVAGIQPKPARIPLYSTLTGGATPGEALGPAYWARQAAATVRFAEGLRRLLETGCDLLVEIGPRPALVSAAARTLQAAGLAAEIHTAQRRGRGERAGLLDCLGALYTRGVPIDWRPLHASPGRALRLPTTPWQRRRCWFESSSPEGAGRALLPAGEAHPLLGQPLPTAAPTWEAHLDAGQPWLGDHQLRGGVIFPGSGYVALGHAALVEARGPGAASLSDVVFSRALSLRAGTPTPLQLTLTGEGDGRQRFRVHSPGAGAGAPWQLHASGVLHTEPPGPRSLPEEAIDAVKARCAAADGAALYEALRAHGFDYGPAYQRIEAVWAGAGEALAQLRASGPEGYRSPHPELDPALLDACLQTFAATLADADTRGGMALPVGLERIKVYQPLTGPLFCHARLRPPEEQGVGLIEGDLRILSADGATVAEIIGLRFEQLAFGAAADARPLAEERYAVRWEPLASIPASPTPAPGAPPPTWLIFAAEDGLADALAQQLTASGQRCVFALPGDGFARQGPDSMQLRPAHAGDLAQLLAALAGEGAGELRGIVHLWSAEAEDPASLTSAGIAARQRLGSLNALELSRLIVESPWASSPPRLWLVTRGAQSLDGDPPAQLTHAPMWGLGRVIANEHPALRCASVDLGASSPAAQAPALASLLLADGPEDQIALRAEGAFAARLHPFTPEDEAQARALPRPPLTTEGGAYHLRLSRPGSLDNLILEGSARRPPGPGEVEIQVRATGLNFRDVMKALGIYPTARGDLFWLGDECAGVVSAVGPGVALRVGDPVVGVAPDSFAAYATTRAELVLPLPAGLGFEEAAALPIAFTTAYYALVHLGRLQRGERVLIHAGAGGVGMAAVAIARWIGAEIFATVGSDEKRQALSDVGVAHILSSRSLAFADQIREITGGRGVDLVLNSLSGEAIDKSLESLGDYGRFVEIGKRDIYQNSRIGLRPFRRNLSLFAVDMDAVYTQRTALGRTLLKEVLDHVAAGHFAPPPQTVFPVADVAGAFRYMALRRNIGKIVVSHAEAPATVAPSPAQRLRPDRAYLITGGLGGLGLKVAEWMAGGGARHLILMGRRSPGAAAQGLLDTLRARGISVTVALADVADEDALAAALSQLRASGPPLAGIIHAAGQLADAPLLKQTAATMSQVMAPKVAGAWNLHRLTQGDQLDFFVLFSSLASVLGSPGQANYAAGNAFMDALASHRRALGLPALSISWGPWAEVGMAAQEGTAERMRLLGLEAIPPREGLQILGELLPCDAHVTVARARWATVADRFGAGRVPPLLSALREELPAGVGRGGGAEGRDPLAASILAAPAEGRGALVEGYFQKQLARIMDLDPREIDLDQPLGGLGFDSLMALELLSSAESRLGIRIPMDGSMQDASVRQLSQVVLSLMEAQGEAASASAAAPASAAASTTPAAVAGPDLGSPASPTPQGGAAAQRIPPATADRRTSAGAPTPPPSGAPSPGESATAQADEAPGARDYASHARPRAAQSLRAFRLDKDYVASQGDHMIYREDGRDVEVLDLLGGYGSTLLGHNHPELVALAQRLLGQGLAIHAQAAIRGDAGLLARELGARIKAATGQDYITTLVSTGTEAIEAALKHAIMEHLGRVDALSRREARASSWLIHQRRGLPAGLDQETWETLSAALGAAATADLSSLVAALAEGAAQVRSAPPVILALSRAFHGKTLGSLQLTANPRFSKMFASHGGGIRVVRVPVDDPAALAAAVEAETRETLALSLSPEGSVELIRRPFCQVAALVLEPVQGEGGIHVLDPAFLRQARAAADAHGFPVIADEIQCGLGRCGAFTASERLGFKADYYTFAKSLGGGLAKIAALAVDRERYQPDFALVHTSTFAEDSFSARLGLATLEIIERDDLAGLSAARGEHLVSRLRALQARYPQVIREIRGLGLMVGVELWPQDGSPSNLLRMISQQEMLAYTVTGHLLNEAAIRVGVTQSSPYTIRVEPSAYIEEAELDRFLAAFEGICALILRGDAGRLCRFITGHRGDDLPAADPLPPPSAARPAEPPPAAPAPASGGDVPRIAFLMHPLEATALLSWDPSMAEIPRALQPEFFKRIHEVSPPVRVGGARIRSITGAEVDLDLISFMTTSQLIEAALRSGDTRTLVEQIDSCVAELEASGYAIAGLGGYISIIMHNGRRVSAPNIGVTTGNSLTVATGLQALREGCRQRGIDLSRARLGAVGARGNICSSYVRIMAREVPRMLLVGRSQRDGGLLELAALLYSEAWERIEREERGALTGLADAIADTAPLRQLRAGASAGGDVGMWIAAQLKETFGADPFIQTTDDLSRLATCDVIVTASNASTPILFPRHLADAPVVICDISVPADVSPDVARERPDVLLMNGGLVHLPCNPDFELPGGELPRGHAYACLAETILLGLTRHEGSFSLGPIRVEDVLRIEGVAAEHGFTLGQYGVQRSR